jgi:hypothetical protein
VRFFTDITYGSDKLMSNKRNIADDNKYVVISPFLMYVIVSYTDRTQQISFFFILIVLTPAFSRKIVDQEVYAHQMRSCGELK